MKECFETRCSSCGRLFDISEGGCHCNCFAYCPECLDKKEREQIEESEAGDDSGEA